MASADAEPSTSAKIRHACAAVVAEGTGGEGKAFALLPAGLSATHTHGLVPADGDEFATGLQLLQNDVVSLCIAAGVPADALNRKNTVGYIMNTCFEELC